MHIASLMKIPCYLLKLSSGNKYIWACLGQITPIKFDEIFPLAIPYQISLMSIDAYSKFGKNPLLFTQVIVQKNMCVSRADNYVKN